MTKPGRPRGKQGPQRRGTTRQMVDFFAQNPDEELTFPDMELKFGASRYGTLAEAARRLSSTGLFERVYVVRLTSVGRAAVEGAADPTAALVEAIKEQA